MAETFQSGPYTLTTDPRGVRIRRALQGGMRSEISTLLLMRLYEDGSQPMVFMVHRMVQIDELSVGFHAYTTDKVSLEGSLIYRQEIDGLNLSIELVNATEDMQMRFEATLELTGEADPEWLIPGLFYNENRVRECSTLYPAYSEIQRDPPKYLSNHWCFRTDRAALPAVICKTYGQVAFITTEEVVGVTDNRRLGIGPTSIGFSSEEGFPILKVQAPYVEEPVSVSFCSPNRLEPEETLFHLEKSESFTMDVQLGFVPFSDTAREEVYRRLYDHRWDVKLPRPRLSTLAAQRVAIEGLDRWHLDEQAGIIHERATFDKHFGQYGKHVEDAQMHVGWLCGAFPAYVLLWHGRDTTDPEYVRKATRVLDTMTADLAPCGSMWPVISLEDGPCAGAGPEDNLAHSRTIAEATFFLARAIRLELQANTAHSRWFHVAISNLNFIVERQDEKGAFPSYWNLNDGRVTGYEGTAGLFWIAPLIAFHHYFASNAYLEAALKAGEYYSQFVEHGFLYGSVEDLPFIPTADDCHLALIAYLLLYEADHSQQWLDLAKKAADLALTYRFVTNVRFSPFSLLSQTEFMTRGGDIYSVAAPVTNANGLISYGEMRKLTALTGDKYYEQRAREGRTFATQMLARVDGEYNARRGQGIGQVFHSDWWQPKGIVLSLSYAYTCALIAHTELIEQHLEIPLAALQGDHGSVVEAAERASVIQMQKDLVLPDPADLRRQRELEARKSRLEAQKPAPTPSPPVRPATGYEEQPRRRPITPPADPAAHERQIFPFEPPGQSVRPTSPSGTQRPPSETRERPAAQSGAGTRQKTPLSQRHTPLSDEPSSFGPPPSGFGQQTPPPSAPPPKPERRHTPLSEMTDHPSLADAGFGVPNQPPPGSAGMMPSGFDQHPEARKADLPPLPEPPPEIAEGLLSNLMHDQGGSHRSIEFQQTPRPTRSEPPARSSTPPPASGSQFDEKDAEEDEPSDEVQIKWKIF